MWAARVVHCVATGCADRVPRAHPEHVKKTDPQTRYLSPATARHTSLAGHQLPQLSDQRNDAISRSRAHGDIRAQKVLLGALQEQVDGHNLHFHYVLCRYSHPSQESENTSITKMNSQTSIATSTKAHMCAKNLSKALERKQRMRSQTRRGFS